MPRQNQALHNENNTCYCNTSSCLNRTRLLLLVSVLYQAFDTIHVYVPMLGLTALHMACKWQSLPTKKSRNDKNKGNAPSSGDNHTDSNSGSDSSNSADTAIMATLLLAEGANHAILR